MPRLLGLSCVLTLVSLLLMGGCGSFEGETILGFSDPDAAFKVDVRSQMYGGKTRVHLLVARGDEKRRMVLADGVELHNALLVRYNNWLLVCAGKYVLGGYDIEGDRIVTMNSEALPFTVRNVSGYVVDEKTIGAGEDAPPINFREREDPRQ